MCKRKRGTPTCSPLLLLVGGVLLLACSAAGKLNFGMNSSFRAGADYKMVSASDAPAQQLFGSCCSEELNGLYLNKVAKHARHDEWVFISLSGSLLLDTLEYEISKDMVSKDGNISTFPAFTEIRLFRISTNHVKYLYYEPVSGIAIVIDRVSDPIEFSDQEAMDWFRERISFSG